MVTKPNRYEIHVEGHLDERWTSWFEGMTICKTFDAQGKPITSLTGTVVDQSALCGVLSRVCDLGVHLISVQRQQSSETDRSNDSWSDIHT
jgi:hypothetical protein